jgi:pimeloyl-ACP methyl ester carboxylesterase
MLIDVNGARLFVDIEGAGLVPDGPAMRRKPTLVLLHGGPGYDHSMFKPAFSQLADVAQVVYLDHRGHGRSSRGKPAEWNLAQWGDDVRGVCDVLGVEKPVVLGFSFGGYVAQAYATRHPRHPGKLVLASTAAIVDEAGPAGSAAEDASARMICNDRIAWHFTREQTTMDFRPVLRRIACPTLVLAGALDDVMPKDAPEVLMAGIRSGLAELQMFPKAGHPIPMEAPKPFFLALRRFLAV